MSIRLSKAFGPSPETWLGMQMASDLWQARERSAEISVEHFVDALSNSCNAVFGRGLLGRPFLPARSPKFEILEYNLNCQKVNDPN